LLSQRTHRSGRQNQEFSVDTFELPFGIHLPPYIESDPNKELNPPSYEQIFPQPKEEPVPNHSHTFNIQSRNNNCYQVTVDIVWIWQKNAFRRRGFNCDIFLLNMDCDSALQI
jgi:hypothetical protein